MGQCRRHLVVGLYNGTYCIFPDKSTLKYPLARCDFYSGDHLPKQ